MTEVVSLDKPKESLWDKHKAFVSNTYQITAYIVGIYVFIERIYLTIQSGFEGNLAAVLVQLIFFSILVAFNTIIGTALWGTLALLVLFLPYLLYRGIKN